MRLGFFFLNECFLTCFISHFHFPVALAEVLPQLPEQQRWSSPVRSEPCLTPQTSAWAAGDTGGC